MFSIDNFSNPCTSNPCTSNPCTSVYPSEESTVSSGSASIEIKYNLNQLPYLNLERIIPLEFHPIIHELFKRNALDDAICLNELLGLDTFKLVSDLKTIINQNNIKNLEKDFENLYKSMTMVFAAGAVFLLAETTDTFNSEKFLKHSNFFIGKERILLELETQSLILRIIKTKLMSPEKKNNNLKPSSRKRLEEIFLKRMEGPLKLVSLCEQNFKLISWIWNSADTNDLLLGNNIRNYAFSIEICKDEVITNLEGLKSYIDYVSQIGIIFKSFNLVGLEINYFNYFNNIKNLKEVDIKELKEFSNDLAKSQGPGIIRTNQEMNVEISNAINNELTYEQWCKSKGFSASRGKNHTEFCQTLITQYLFWTIILLYVADIHRILETRIINIINPDILTCNSLYTRFEKHLSRILVPNSFHNECNIHTFIDNSNRELIHKFNTNIRIMSEQFDRSLNMYWPTTKEIDNFITVSNKNLPTVHLYFLMQPFRRCITHLQEVILPTFKKAQEQIFKQIKKDLANLAPNDPQINYEKLIQALTNICLFQFSIVFSKIYVIRDAHYFLKSFEDNSFLYELGESQNPQEITDFFLFNGLEDIFNAHYLPRTDKSIIPVQLESSNPDITATEETPIIEEMKDEDLDLNICDETYEKKEFESIPLPLIQESPVFKIEDGEKIRKIKIRLNALGFIHISTRGSHMKYEHTLTGATVILPDHKILKKGTAKSLEDQVKNGLQIAREK